MAILETIGQAVAEEFTDIPDLASGARVVSRLLLAAVLGGFLGWDRERMGKAAGLRTHMLVTAGSALFVLVPQQMGMGAEALARVIQGLITGLGFIGGGAILKLADEKRVQGVTTAAGIWLTAGIGVAAGLGRGMMAVLAAIVAFAILALLRPLEHWLDRPDRHAGT
jgi:putative Mg2+ transporter-C (MgtC) family protein